MHLLPLSNHFGLPVLAMSRLIVWIVLLTVPLLLDAFTTSTKYDVLFGTRKPSASSSSSESFPVMVAGRSSSSSNSRTDLAATRPRGKRKSSTTSSTGEGFGTSSTPSPSATTSTTSSKNTDKEKSPPKEEEEGGGNNKNKDNNIHTRIYSLPALYDMAFGYRNFELEVDFLIGQHQLLHEGRPPTRILELAAGPARHSIYALQSSMTQFATALDNSQEMVDYGKDIAFHELGNNDEMSSSSKLLDAFQYLQGDMSSFEMTETFDSVWILLGSLQHLITNDQVISCLNSVHKVLAPGGTLIIELPHPRETFSLVECTRNGWEVPLEDDNGTEYGELAIVWGDDNDEFDPIQQVRQFTVAMDLTRHDTTTTTTTDSAGGVVVENEDDHQQLQSVREVVPLRLFTAQEIDVLGRIAGFQVTSMYGALADDVSVNDDEEAFRLVCVLQKENE